jgi:hypothetical protein
LETVLWWIAQTRRSWRWCPLHISRQKITQICSSNPLASYKQWSRIQSPYPQASSSYLS